MARFEHPLWKQLRTPIDPRACAAPGLDQPLAAEKVERAHDRRPADAEFLGESAFRRQTGTRPQPPTNDRGAQLVRNACIARTHPRPAAAAHIQPYAQDFRADPDPPRGKTGLPLPAYLPWMTDVFRSG